MVRYCLSNVTLIRNVVFPFSFLVTGLVIMFFPSILNAQDLVPGQIIMLNRDTIDGFISISGSSHHQCSFKIQSRSTSKKYNADEIIGYSYGDWKQFVSLPLKNSSNEDSIRVFYEVLVTGKISLLGYMKKYYIRDSEEKITELEVREKEVFQGNKKYIQRIPHYKGVLRYYFNDCRKITSGTIKRIKLAEKSLTEVFQQYNECSGSEFEVIKDNLPWTEVKYGPAIGLMGSRIWMWNEFLAYPVVEEALYDLSPIIGFGFDIKSPRLSRKLSFSTGFYFSSFSASAYLSYSEFTVIRHYDITVESKYVFIPALIKYKLAGRSVEPFVSLGITNYIIYGSESENYIEFQYPYGQVITEKLDDYPIGFYHYGITGSLGLESRLIADRTMTLELRFDYGNGIFSSSFLGRSTTANASVFLHFYLNR